MKKLWIVHGSTGEYSDRSEWNVAVADCEDDAKLLVIALQQQYLSIPQEMLEDRWGHEEAMKAIMSLDPCFQCDYTGTHYFYGWAPHYSRLDIERIPAASTLSPSHSQAGDK
ncbi:MAG: hypothetical protein WC807_14760 [Hyphomicrobium sp.]|jgi:hypothetical protein